MQAEVQFCRATGVVAARWAAVRAALVAAVVVGCLFWPLDGVAGLVGKHRTIGDDDRTFWSFQPVKHSPAPAVRNGAWCRNAVDRFVLDKLETEGLTPAAEADRPTLIRRATFDLTGLPPTPQEVDAFVRDRSPDAYEKLIDRLLASPRYGERWGRHWLDLVRYAESDGFKQDAYRPSAWPYRDYVIRSFNEDKPYDRFVCEQLAGDELWPEDPDALIATGYLRHGIYEYNQRDVPKQWAQMLTDVTDVTGDVFLGLSMGCARCHDHKFDPILQTDYFRLQALFAPILPREVLIATAAQKQEHARAQEVWEKKTTAIREQMEPIERAAAENAAKAAINKFTPELQVMLRKSAAERTPLEEQLAQLAFRQVYGASDTAAPKVGSKNKAKYAALTKELAEYDALKPAPLLRGLMTTDVGPVAPPTFVPGHADQPLEPGIPVVLEGLPGSKLAITPSATSTGRRSALARWVTEPQNPLTSRVIVNRIWQYHFGKGLVGTSSDFGHLGVPPTHPELLDWLANRFIEQGWSFKQMHRLIMTSATYRQAALRPAPQIARLKDPEDRWLWRMNTQRLNAEQIRDAMLSASGELQLESGGPSVETSEPRRAVYTKVVRNTRDPVLDAFDAPDSFASVCLRNVTTTPTQSLLMINGDWPLKRAAAFASRVKREASSADAGAMVDVAYRLAYSRAPQPDERQAALKFLSHAAVPSDPKEVVASQAAAAFDLPVRQSMPQRDGQAILVRSANPGDMLSLSADASLPDTDFTVEAYVQLESYYDNGRVRVIASRWDGQKDHTGWALGVTSDKSKYQPHTLILQIVGKDGYDVIPSELQLDLHKAYYVGACVNTDEGGEPGVTFHLKDITDMDAPLKSITVHRKLAGPFASQTPFVIGGSAAALGHIQGWDGLIDEVRICRTALKPEQLLYGGNARGLVVGYWQFEEHPGFLRDTAGVQKDLKPLAARPAPARSSASTGGPNDQALTDFCHVLLNSNEFLYVD